MIHTIPCPHCHATGKQDSETISHHGGIVQRVSVRCSVCQGKRKLQRQDIHTDFFIRWAFWDWEERYENHKTR